MTTYLRKINNQWHYRPPRKAVIAGVVSPWVEDDGRTATAKAKKDNKQVTAWQRGEISGEVIDEDSNLSQIAAHYMNTSHYLSLTKSTQKTYTYLFRVVSESFGPTAVSNIKVAQCQRVYDEWVRESVANAKMKVRAVGLLFSHAMAYDLVYRNPMVSVKKVKHKPPKIIWTKDQVQKFVDTAFSKWEWRNIGLLALLCYEYAQRPIDIATLTWDKIDFDNNTITINQSKRGATVYVPLDEDLKGLLLNQYQDFKFQEWVLPQLRAIDGCYRPYTNNNFASLASKIIDEAGLPKELALGKLRNTAITEMVEAGVDSTGIMQVSGHADIKSLNPYLKNTLKGSTAALNKRKQG